MEQRDKHLPLTETTYYTLLALRTPAHGYWVMQLVKEMSSGGVDMAAGTMYGALDTLRRQGLIQLVKGQDARRKTYQITPYGSQVLEQDIQRLRQMIVAAERQGV